jgi:hypothetical protein
VYFCDDGSTVYDGLNDDGDYDSSVHLPVFVQADPREQALLEDLSANVHIVENGPHI